MDSKIMGLINTEIEKLPQKNRKQRYQQYEAGKRKLTQMFPGGEDYEYISKALAKKYGI